MARCTETSELAFQGSEWQSLSVVAQKVARQSVFESYIYTYIVIYIYTYIYIYIYMCLVYIHIYIYNFIYSIYIYMYMFFPFLSILAMLTVHSVHSWNFITAGPTKHQVLSLLPPSSRSCAGKLIARIRSEMYARS